ncbi:nuclear factor I/Xb isoform X1 [Lates japonicus]|uniref:Nuclear factor I/Xb isoform X1 n=1 Tax=Lates japonicus TaxID=270547 RepID=A0AAD3R8K4_LATJO|nr:nuclear factor I/Xb isoform X1 [Lates japonicus]
MHKPAHCILNPQRDSNSGVHAGYLKLPKFVRDFDATYSTPGATAPNRFVGIGSRDNNFLNIPQQTQDEQGTLTRDNSEIMCPLVVNLGAATRGKETRYQRYRKRGNGGNKRQVSALISHVGRLVTAATRHDVIAS